VQHLRPEARQLEHLVVCDAGELARPGNDAWIARIDSVDVGVDLADVRLERRCDRHGRRVRAAAPERRDAAVLRDPLKARHDRHFAGAERGPKRRGADRADTSSSEGVVRHDRYLKAEKRPGRNPAILQHECEQAGGHLLARGGQHVALGVARCLCSLAREREEAAGLAGHGAHDHDQIVPAAALAGDTVGHVPDAIDVAHRRAAILLNDECHAASHALPPASAAASHRACFVPYARKRTARPCDA